MTSCTLILIKIAKMSSFPSGKINFTFTWLFKLLMMNVPCVCVLFGLEHLFALCVDLVFLSDCAC